MQGEAIATLGPALAVHQTSPAQRTEDLVEELARQLLSLGQLVGGDRRPALGLPGGKGQGSAYGVVGGGGDVHGTSLPGQQTNGFTGSRWFRKVDERPTLILHCT